MLVRWEYVLWGWVGCINLVAFALWGWDKLMAIKTGWRVSEKRLLRCSLLGGWLGALTGMQLFRHKTIKGTFLWKFWLIVFAWLAVLLGLLFR